MSLILYGDATGNTRRAAIALEEAGLAYTTQKVDLARGEHRQPAFLALNPRAKVPVLIEAGRPPLTQSNAIMFEIAARTGTLLPDRDRAQCLEWYFLVLTDLALASNYAGIARREGEPGAADKLDARALAMYDQIEARLATVPFLGGDTFSIADIMGLTITSYLRDKLDPALVHTFRWLDAVCARPAVKRGLAVFTQ